MRKSFYLAAAVAIAFSSTAANASLTLSPAPVVNLPITPPASGTFGNSFGNPGDAHAATPGMFTDTFNFTLTAGTLGNAFLGSISLNSGNDIDFSCPACSIRFDSTAFTPGTTVVNGQNLDTFTLSPQIIGSGPHSITVTGNIVSGPTASYSGTFNFQSVPVPEPATWAMMLLGFAGIGIVMRSRRRSTRAAVA